MNIDNIKEKLIKNLQQTAEKIKKELTSRSYSKNKFKAKMVLNGYLSDLDKLNQEINSINYIFSADYKYYIEKYPRLLDIIMKSDLTLIEKIETICYLININYNFFTNEVNILKYTNNSSMDSLTIKDIKKFNNQKNIYLNLRNVIREDNTVGKIKIVDDDVYVDFKKIGFPEDIINLIMDMAMRNYENSEIMPKR